MKFRITARHGAHAQRYHTYEVEAPDARSALIAAASALPGEIAGDVDLVELRVAVDPEERSYAEE